jgi:hypothetical protein
VAPPDNIQKLMPVIVEEIYIVRQRSLDDESKQSLTPSLTSIEWWKETGINLDIETKLKLLLHSAFSAWRRTQVIKNVA